MRLAIKGKEINIVVTADRDLTIQEIMSAQQIVTGDFEALFIKNEDQPELKIDEIMTKVDYGKKYYDYGEVVSVSVMCPICGLAKELKGRYGNRYTKCPSCSTKLHNAPATSEGYGTEDERGNFYHAYDILKESDPFGSEEIFEGGDEGAE